MVRKLTREIILEAIEEELSKIDEVGMFSGIGSAIGGMAKDVKGKFQKHRAPAVAQKLAQKYQQELSDVSSDFVGIADSFEKDYTKWKANPFLKKVLDDLEFIESMGAAADSIEQVAVKLDNASQGNIELEPQAPKKPDYRGVRVPPSVKQNMPEALQQVKSILKENKKIRIIKTNGQKK
jgi:hypothetical protein